MKITNSEAQYAYAWMQMPLHGTQSRMRTRFLKQISSQYAEAVEKRKAILASFADKDAKKAPVMENGLYKISEKSMDKARAAVGKHLDEAVEYRLSKDDKAAWKSARAILSDMKTPLSGAEAEIYASLMDKLDSMGK